MERGRIFELKPRPPMEGNLSTSRMEGDLIWVPEERFIELTLEERKGAKRMTNKLIEKYISRIFFFYTNRFFVMGRSNKRKETPNNTPFSEEGNSVGA